MINIIIKVLKHSFMITGFVFVMMLVIEYINVQTRGMWQQLLTRNAWLQYVLAALLGAVPGCLGAFTVVTLFSHGIVSMGALVAAMIATSGDETFVMLTMIPEKAIFVIGLTFLIGIIAGMLTDKLLPKLSRLSKFSNLPIHKEEKCECIPKGKLFINMKDPSMPRILLIVIILMLLVGILTGSIAGEMKNWMKSTILITSVISLFIVMTVPEHFISEHLWEHIVKLHIPRIFIWTFGALLVIHILMHYIDINSWIAANKFMILLVAALVGLIPESGPHLVFVSLFAQGSIPFSILLANSVVQDGHGMIPMLAESKRSFMVVKAVNLIVGLAAGYLVMGFGY